MAGGTGAAAMERGFLLELNTEHGGVVHLTPPGVAATCGAQSEPDWAKQAGDGPHAEFSTFFLVHLVQAACTC